MLNSPEEEIRKTIFSALLAGETFLLYDEAHDIDSAQLVEKLTSSTVTDRPLGRTDMISVRQQVTWVAAGNNVLTQADLARRHYRIDMFWEGTGDPSLRDSRLYRHQDIRRWVKDNRRDLVRACLILIRAWYAAGQPEAETTPNFGSYEQWTSRIAGILHHAGVPGFLDNLEDARSDNDTVSEIWGAHFRGLHHEVGDEWMLAKDVVRNLRVNQDMTRPPLKYFDVGADTAPMILGRGYAGKVGRTLGGITLQKRRTADGTKYRLVADEGDDMSESGGTVMVGDTFSYPHVGNIIEGVATETPYKGVDGSATHTTSITGGGSAFSGGILQWSPDPKHPGVLTSRLPDGWVSPERHPAARNSRFDDLLELIDPLRPKCRPDHDATLHPGGDCFQTCRTCYPGDFAQPGFNV
jgi:hypothetical protein